MNTYALRLRNIALGLVLIMPAAGYSAPGDLANQPLFLASTVEPNVLFLLDDSGSMRWGFMPDELDTDFDLEACGTDNKGSYAGNRTTYCGVSGREYLVSNTLNKAYYNPAVNYTAPVKGDGTRYPDASFLGAYVDGYAQSGSTINLSNNYRAIMDDFFYLDYNSDDNHYEGFTVGVTGSSGEAAFYYSFSSSSSCDSNPRQSNCYTRVSMANAGDAEKQNFANWFSYYRTRLMASKAGISAAFVDQPEGIRVGYGSLNHSGRIVRGVEQFSGTSRAEFFTWLQDANASGGTPLRASLEDAGEYFKRTDNDGPWAGSPGSTSTHLECRQSFSILMTDGYYGSERINVGNVDGTDGSAIGDYQYESVAPFSDDRSDTLADVAMEYWVNDLRTDLDNSVPVDPDTHNPAFWQHMVTYGVGLGVAGTVEPQAAFDAIETGDAIAWADTSTRPGKIDDLLHAAVNGRGGFFSASDPDTFATNLSEVLASIVATVGSSSGVTFNTATLETDTLLFGARFDSSRWSGELFALGLTDNGSGAPTVATTESWEAGAKLDARDLSTNPRVIMTYNGSVSVPFQWANLTTGQLADLTYGTDAAAGLNRLNYLRGQNVTGLRTRDSRLGDIVNSTPVYVQAPSLSWPNAAPFGVTGNTYADFRAAQESRRAVTYVGANDGMLHAFASDTTASAGGGDELFAYVPDFVFSAQNNEGLHYLTETNYQHRYYVDLTPVVADVYTAGPNGATADWRTVLIGGARSGARGLFALDITNPEGVSESAAADLALWEFTSDDDARLGYLTEPPTIALASWGNNDFRWTAFLGNGYNSTTSATGMFMLDLEGGLDGSWTEDSNQNGNGDYRFVSFETGAGATGLSPVRLLDLTGDQIIDRVYGGDLNGNIWVSQRSGNGSWDPAYSAPLFTANRNNVAQPITAAPMVIRNPATTQSGNAPNLMVLFGTGQYLVDSDPTNTDIQSFYGVLDKGVDSLERSDLVSRTLTESTLTVDGQSYEVRESDGAALVNQSGWYVDFDTEAGERITQSPQVRGKYVFINSIIPSTNPCEVGGGGWLMAFGLDGQTPDRAVFTRFGVPVVGYRTDGGLPNKPGFLGDYMLTPKSNDEIIADEVDVGADPTDFGRMSWQEIVD